MKTERSNSTDNGQHRAEEKPGSNRHVLSRFPVLRAVAKRACKRFLRSKQDRQEHNQSELRKFPATRFGSAGRLRITFYARRQKRRGDAVALRKLSRNKGGHFHLMMPSRFIFL